MSKAKKLEYHFAAIFRERIVAPKNETLKTYGKFYLGTFYPKNTEEVHLIVKYCNIHHIHIIQKQQNIEHGIDKDFIFISFSKMTAIEVLEEEKIVILDVGVETSDLIGLLEYKNFSLPCIDKSKRNILLDILNDYSLNQNQLYPYGSLSSFILSIEGVLGSGDIVKLGSSSYSGSYSDFLKQMLLNTYGQFGIITKLKIKVLPNILAHGLFRIEAYNIATGMKILQKLSYIGIYIDDFYFFDKNSIEKIWEYKKLPITKEAPPYLFLLQLSDSSLEDLSKLMDRVSTSLADVLEGIISIEKTQLPEEIEKQLAFKDEIEAGIASISYHHRTEYVSLNPSKHQYFISDLDYLKKDFGIDFLFSGSLQGGNIKVIFMNIQDETGLVWDSFQYEIRAKVLDILYVYGGRPMTYHAKEQSSIESFFMGNEAFILSQKIQKLCDPKQILIPTNQL